MTGQKFLDSYSGQTTDELIALEAEYRADSLVLAFEQAIDQKASEIGAEKLTDEERVVLAVEALEREVNNGGFEQFFLNSSREFTPIVVDALRRIACNATAELTEEAIGVLGIEGPVTVEAVESVMDDKNEDVDDRLGNCDDRYYELEEDIAGALLDFIKSNRSEITVPGT